MKMNKFYIFLYTSIVLSCAFLLGGLSDNYLKFGNPCIADFYINHLYPFNLLLGYPAYLFLYLCCFPFLLIFCKTNILFIIFGFLFFCVMNFVGICIFDYFKNNPTKNYSILAYLKYIFDKKKYNKFSIIAFLLSIFSLICWLPTSALSIVFGHIAYSQCKKNNSSGKALAIIGILFGYFLTFLFFYSLIEYIS